VSLNRTRDTLGLYAAIGCLSYLLAGMGAILPELRADRGLSRLEAALYPSAFAVGLVVIGVAGHRLARLLGRQAVPAALIALIGGIAVLAVVPSRPVSGIGALIYGLGGAALVQLVPVRLRAAHGDQAVVAIGEANALGSAASVLAPVIIGVCLAGPGWQVGLVALPAVAAVALLAGPLRAGHTMPRDPAPVEKGPMPRGFLGWWVDLVLAVSAEFCMLLWAVDYFKSAGGLSSSAATFGAAGFTLGMAAGRTLVGPATRLVAVPVRLLAAAATLALLGFALFWSAAGAALMVAGLFSTGLGVALLYPVTLAQALATWPGQPDRAAARCALASGVAVGAAPLLLGAWADAVGLRVAYLLAPATLVAFIAHCLIRLADRPGAAAGRAARTTEPRTVPRPR